MKQPAWDTKELTIGQVAARSGVTVSALHFYESKGLIESKRSSGNQRRFGREVIRRVAFIRVARRVGVPLSAIREALSALPEERTPTRADWAMVSEGWRRELDERILALEALRDTLADCIGCGCLSMNSCVLTNPYDVLGKDGPGPRKLSSPSEDPWSGPRDR